MKFIIRDHLINFYHPPECSMAPPPLFHYSLLIFNSVGKNQKRVQRTYVPIKTLDSIKRRLKYSV